MKEKTSDYYTQIYSKGYSTERYKYIYLAASGMCHGKILDMGCGTQEFREYLSGDVEYDGFDFADISGVRKDNLYTADLNGYDSYVMLEVLEHVNDTKILSRIPEGKNVAFSVPTFKDESHLRTYTKKDIFERFDGLVDISKIHTFSYDGKYHIEGNNNPSIYLVQGTIKHSRKERSAVNDITIGACMIVKNEEECLETCLRSIDGLDGIIILDTGSTDKTADVAADFNCIYIADEYKWQDDFAHARNEALKHNNCDYVLVIDADEQLIGGVNQLRREVEKHAGSLTMQMKTKSERGTNQHLAIRVHKNDKDVYWKGACHNYLTAVGGPVLEGIGIEYGYSPAHKQDPDRAIRILKKCCKNDPMCARERYYLAREYYYRKDYDECFKHLHLYWLVSQFAAEKADSKLMAARCMIEKGDYRNAWKYCFDALQINADIREAYVLLSQISGPKNKIHWLKRAENATNENVLFIRN